MEAIDEVTIHPNYLDHKVQFATKLNKEVRIRLIEFLKENYGFFDWSHEDMTRIDPEVVGHRLQVHLDYSPVKQKTQKFVLE